MTELNTIYTLDDVAKMNALLDMEDTIHAVNTDEQRQQMENKRRC